MRRVPIDKLEPGMELARTIVGFTGRALLTKNTILTQTYITRLARLGIGSIYIKDGFDDSEIPEIIADEVFSLVSDKLSTTLKTFYISGALNVDAYKNSVNMLLDSIINNRHVLIQLEDIRAYSDHIFTHSINVAVYAIMTGISMGYQERQLAVLGLGALLHDIGMIVVDPAVLSEPEALANLDDERINQHPEFGFNILRNYQEISTIASHIAYQHHERFDGTGFPRGLKGKEILDFARIVAVTDTFDNLVADRPDRDGLNTTDALINIKNRAGTHFDPEMVEAFASNVAMYPVGCLVKLNSGHTAVVTEVKRASSDRPVINIIYDASGNTLKPSMAVDLSLSKDIEIVRRLSIEETEAIRGKIET